MIRRIEKLHLICQALCFTDHLQVKTKNLLPSAFVVFEYPVEKDSSAAERLQSYSSNDSIPSHLSFANLLTNHLPLVPDLLTRFSTVPTNYSPAEHTPQRSKMSFMISAHSKALEVHQSLIFPFLWLTYLQKLVVYCEIQQGECIRNDSSVQFQNWYK